MGKTEDYWQKFLDSRNGDKDKYPYGGEVVFGMDEMMSIELTSLVLAGKKRATTSVLEAYKIDNERLPVVGLCYVVTDWYGEPVCIIREEKVDILPFNQVPWSMAEKEGEDDSLESWRMNHVEAFEEDGAIMGYEFSQDMPVVFEEFRVINMD